MADDRLGFPKHNPLPVKNMFVQVHSFGKRTCRSVSLWKVVFSFLPIDHGFADITEVHRSCYFSLLLYSMIYSVQLYQQT